jgi:hypothetical protein
MKTIPTNDHQLRCLLTAQLIRPQQSASSTMLDETPIELAAHDFLVLTARPDLTPEIHPTMLRHELPTKSRSLR